MSLNNFSFDLPEGVRALRIVSTKGDIVLRRYDRKTLDISSSRDMEGVHTQVQGDTMTIELGEPCAGQKPLRILGFALGRMCDVRVEIDVPLGIRIILVEIGVGDFSSQMLNVERLSLDAGTGDVRLKNCDIPYLSIRTELGDVSMEGIDTRYADIETGMGDIRMEDLHTVKLFVHTGTGSVVGRGIRAESGEIVTGIGDIRMEGYIGRVHLDAGVGEVIIE